MGCTYWHLGLQVLAQAAGAPQAHSRVHATLWQVQDCMWCCIWEALILCCGNGGAAEHAHLPTQVRDAHVPVKFSSLASVVSHAEAHAIRSKVRALLHHCLQHAADIGSLT